MMDTPQNTRPVSPPGPSPEDPLYIERAADGELLRALSAGEFAHVLGPPGSGKSSLCRHLSARLAEGGARCVSVDLSRMSRLGQRVPQEGFYYAIIGQVGEQFGLPDPTDFWNRREGIVPARRFASYLRDELLVWVAEQVVLFIDGIDAVRAIGPESDSFFAALHGLLAERATDRSLRRLSVCLLGTVPPAELIRGATLEPARIARQVILPDFTTEQATAFLAHLPGDADQKAALLGTVLEFTDGEPSSTRRLCQALSDTGHAFGLGEQERVFALVEQLFLSAGATDPLLRAAGLPFSADKAQLPPSLQDRQRVVSLYRRLLFHERVPAEEGEPMQLALRLCGLIKEYRDEAGLRWLRVRNRIVESAYGIEWIKEQDHRPLAEPLLRWLRAGKDPSLLLSGEELSRALAESDPGGSLQRENPEEQEFLRAALAVRQEEELRKAREELAEARQVAAAETARSKRTGRAMVMATSAIVLFSSLGSAGLYERGERALSGERSERALLKQSRDEAARDREREARTRRTAEYAVGKLVELSGEPANVASGAAPGVASAAAPGVTTTVASGVTTTAAPGVASGDSWTRGIFLDPPDPLPEKSPERLLDGLFTLALARQPEGRTQALVSAMALLAPPFDGKALPYELSTALYTAVGETLSDHDPITDAAWPVLRGHEGVVRHLAFSPDGKLLATASDDGTARLWETQKDAPQKAIQVLRGHGGLLRQLAFSPDGKFVATASNDNTARIFATADGHAVALLGGHTAEVRSATFAADGKRLATASGDGTVRVWEVPSGRLLSVLRGHQRDVVSAVFSPDDRRLLTASVDGTAALWQGDTGKQIGVLSAHKGALTGAAFSPDGSLLLTAGSDGTARLWSADGKALRVLFGAKDAVLLATFSADGQRVLTAGSDGNARLFDTATGAALATFAGHRGAVLAAALSPDGTRVATGGIDHTTRLWQADGRPLVTLRGQRLAIYAVAFSPDGALLATASGDRTVRLYPATDKGFSDLLCRLLKGRPDGAGGKDLTARCAPGS